MCLPRCHFSTSASHVAQSRLALPVPEVPRVCEGMNAEHNVLCLHIKFFNSAAVVVNIYAFTCIHLPIFIRQINPLCINHGLSDF